MSSFSIGENSFLLDNKEFRIISGAMHYFRVPREYWKDRLLKIKACGFNTVETYTCWNLHEKREGSFDFSGMLDLKAYLELIKELGMYAIVRPGPYICSEWDFGGLPWWLLSYNDIELRCMNKTYLEKVDAYFDKIIPIIADCQIQNGGSVIMVQVENEYGSYGDDSEYIRYIADALRKRGIECELFTSDGDCDFMLRGGTVPEIFKTVNFGSDASGNFRSLRNYQKTGPLMCTEFWNGWFDHWGEKHHKRNPDDAAKAFDEVLSLNGSINVYMMHGGTNFGFLNGANCTETEYQPTVNSYDDDAPIDEQGRLTEKYYKFRDILKKYGYESDIAVSQPEACAYDDISLTCVQDLFSYSNTNAECKETVIPQPMESLGQGYGYIMYETFISGPRERNLLYIDAHDRAYVYFDNEFKGIIYRNDEVKGIELTVPESGVNVKIIVENMGRINYGPYMKDKKGIVSPVRLGNQFIYHWKTYLLHFENICLTPSNGLPDDKFHHVPVFLCGKLNISGTPYDTFIDFSAFGKGIVFVNGFMLSRYWSIGPQKTVYLPAVFLHEGVNEITVLEFEKSESAEKLPFLDKPILG